MTQHFMGLILMFQKIEGSPKHQEGHHPSSIIVEGEVEGEPRCSEGAHPSSQASQAESQCAQEGTDEDKLDVVQDGEGVSRHGFLRMMKIRKKDWESSRKKATLVAPQKIRF
jgi:hypothetical protein